MPDISLFDKNFNKEAIYRYKLSVQLLHDGFVYCILDIDQNKYIALESYSFPQLSNNDQLCNEYEKIITGLDFLKNDFKQIKIIYSDSKVTLIPAPLFEEKEKNTYLNFTENISEGFEINFDKLSNIDAYSVYAIPICIKNKLLEIFSKHRLYHYSGSLLENLLIQFKRQDAEKNIFLNVQSSHFEIIVLEGRKLLFYNSFSYKTPEEFIYFILFVFEQLNLNPENVELTVLGELSQEGPLYEILFKYIRNIKFMTRNDSFKYSEAFQKIPAHYFYNLLNLSLCE